MGLGKFMLFELAAIIEGCPKDKEISLNTFSICIDKSEAEDGNREQEHTYQAECMRTTDVHASHTQAAMNSSLGDLGHELQLYQNEVPCSAPCGQ